MEMARACSFSSGKRFTMRLSDAGMVADAPIPEKARRTMMVTLSLENPMPSEKMPTQAKPTTKVHLALTMSDTRPA